MGKVYLVGAGPGAADLITVRGAGLLRRADIVFYDALVQPEMLALAPHAKQVAVGKRCSRISTDQRFINRNLVEAAAKYDIVVRLKGGDPMLFGRAHEEIDALEAARVSYERENELDDSNASLGGSFGTGIAVLYRGLCGLNAAQRVLRSDARALSAIQRRVRQTMGGENRGQGHHPAIPWRFRKAGQNRDRRPERGCRHARAGL
jgi:hypothetical protein